MLLKNFRSGTFRKQFQYLSFAPSSINQEWTWDDPTVNTILEEANRWLGELNAFTKILPDVNLYIQMHTLKEASASSRIEGTQTRMETAAQPVAMVAPERRDDWQEVHNYTDAMDWAVGKLDELPLSTRLLRDAHRILLRGVRGEHKNPGEFRTSQNWIGGSSLADAAFIPPHHEEVPELMSDLEKFWHTEEIAVPHLVRIALSHYQFETIHPFLDGNGRIGRLMIPLYLVSHGLLAKPSLYLSDFFERNRTNYYDALMRVRISNDLIHWVRFFLRGMAETAAKGRDVFGKVLALRTEVEHAVLTLGKRAANARELLNLLYRKSVVSAADIETALSVSTPTANALIRDFVRLGILKEITGQQRGRAYVFDRYLRMFAS